MRQTRKYIYIFFKFHFSSYSNRSTRIKFSKSSIFFLTSVQKSSLLNSCFLLKQHNTAKKGLYLQRSLCNSEPPPHCQEPPERNTDGSTHCGKAPSQRVQAGTRWIFVKRHPEAAGPRSCWQAIYHIKLQAGCFGLWPYLHLLGEPKRGKKKRFFGEAQKCWGKACNSASRCFVLPVLISKLRRSFSK